MDNLPKLDKLLRSQTLKTNSPAIEYLSVYAECIAKIENVVSVVSDLKNGTSRIYSGRFGDILGIKNYNKENSIWEKTILCLMAEEEREEKYLAELRFFNYLRHIPHKMRPDYYLMSKLRIKSASGDIIDILHRMYYIYSADSDTICYALCLYGILPFDFPGKSIIVNSVTGVSEELTSVKDASILSKREQQILKLINNGSTSADIAQTLSISKNTVSRHRQEILSKLNVRNSLEACRVAKTLRII